MATLPITRVVLFKHGVGAFAHAATVDGDATLELTFKQDEVSDVLKSLTVLDRDGGVIRTVVYDSTKPVERMLQEVALDVPAENSLRGLMSQLKGARVSVTAPGFAPLVGAVVGVDTTKDRTETGTAEKAMLSVLTDQGELHTFDLFRTSLVLRDERLRADLDYYLRVSLSGKKKEGKTFRFRAEGAGSRRVQISYVVAAPVWKATYRILLRGTEAPLLQGWAVVDNVQEEDWNEVELTLVAGLPVSFRHDLYSPRYLQRPVVEVRETTGVLPPEVEQGIERVESYLMELEGSGPQAFHSSDNLSMRASRPVAVMGAAAAGGRTMNRLADVSSVRTQVRERQVGELFQYEVEHPVTIRRNESALVPIVLKPFEGRSVLFYQKHSYARNTLRAVEFKNTTGLTLEGGPVTVMDQGLYVGEAMVETTRPGERRLLAYAVELAVRVDDTFDTAAGVVTSITISGGVAVSTLTQVRRTTYTVQSDSAKEETLYLEHPRSDLDCKLRDEEPLVETTPTNWRLKYPLPSKRTSVFVVEEEGVEQESILLTQATEDQLLSLLGTRFLDAAAMSTLKQAVAVRREMQELESAMQPLDRQQKHLHEQQQRLRENLKSLGDRSGERDLRDRYVATLARHEDELEQIHAGRQDLQKRFEGLKQHLHAVLMSLTVSSVR